MQGYLNKSDLRYQHDLAAPAPLGRRVLGEIQLENAAAGHKKAGALLTHRLGRQASRLELVIGVVWVEVADAELASSLLDSTGLLDQRGD